ncbi:MAG: phytanoyl-CoA dioxygenase family protein [Luteolibacter sp.]|uniref:phytanoyl-CoA dioxygenase family protein n=1 Tax=Luteolibacter sp. TaxID=1962973 RepID=UPI0032640531
MILSDAHRNQFERDGFCVLERVIPPEDLAMLDDSCQSYLDEHTELMERVQAKVLGLSHQGRRYFLPTRHDAEAAMEKFLFGEPMAEIVGGLLGGDAYLFLQLFIVKSSRTGMPFGWHQDSGYLMGQPHEPYISLWCALDDATADNGALHVLPWSQTGTREIAPHHKDKASGDLVGYAGEDPGIIVPVPRGSIVALSSTLFHRSGHNVTEHPRRAFLVSYSPHPVANSQGGLWNQAAPFLKNGARVDEP